jgi:uncharacterized protein YkwD
MLGFVTPNDTSRHSIRGLRIAGASIAAACLVLATAASPVFAWDVSAFSAGDEQLLFTLTNQDRASAGLNVLVNDTYLHQKAEWRAQDMGDRNYFSHEIPPDNTMVFASMQADGYCFKVAGENIGLSTYGDDAATNRIEIAFMNSASHRANILGSWAHMGVGAYKSADGRKLYAVLFSVPCGVVLPTPVPVVTPPPDGTVVAPPPAPVVTAPPPAPTRKPTPRPTVRPTAPPVSTPSPSATEGPTATPSEPPAPSDTPSPTASVAPTVAPTPSPEAAVPSGSLSTQDAVSSLRVRERTVSQGPIDSLFQSLFGGLFAW